MPLSVRTGGHAAIWLRDAAKADAIVDVSRRFDGAWMNAEVRSFEAGIAALEGRPRDAATSFDAVLANRLAVGDPFTHALVTLDAVAVLPPDLVPAGAVDRARSYLEEIGAMPMLERLLRSEASVVSP